MALSDESDDSAEAPTGMSWGFGSFLFEKAFANLAAGLSRMCWGLLLQLAGAGVALLAILLAPIQPGALFLLPVALTAAGVGGLVVLWGEQTCLHLKLPLGMTNSLPGYAWLRAAYGCHLASLLARVARRWLPRGLGSLLTLPLELLGFVFLLLFLRKLAGIIERPDLRKLIDAIFALGAVASLCFAVLAAGRMVDDSIPRQLALPLALGLVGTAVLTLLGAVAFYAVLLWRMAAAAAGFAKFLGTNPDPNDAALEADASVSA
jgi:hypothetical protein